MNRWVQEICTLHVLLFLLLHAACQKKGWAHADDMQKSPSSAHGRSERLLAQAVLLSISSPCDQVSVSFFVPSSDYRLRLAGHVNSCAPWRRSALLCFHSNLTCCFWGGVGGCWQIRGLRTLSSVYSQGHFLSPAQDWIGTSHKIYLAVFAWPLWLTY